MGLCRAQVKDLGFRDVMLGYWDHGKEAGNYNPAPFYNLPAF